MSPTYQIKKGASIDSLCRPRPSDTNGKVADHQLGGPADRS